MAAPHELVDLTGMRPRLASPAYPSDRKRRVPRDWARLARSRILLLTRSLQLPLEAL
jgi:hypothetical protein